MDYKFSNIENAFKILNAELVSELKVSRKNYRAKWKILFKKYTEKQDTNLLQDINEAYEFLENVSNSDFEKFLIEFFYENNFKEDEGNLESNKSFEEKLESKASEIIEELRNEGNKSNLNNLKDEENNNSIFFSRKNVSSKIDDPKSIRRLNIPEINNDTVYKPKNNKTQTKKTEEEPTPKEVENNDENSLNLKYKSDKFSFKKNKGCYFILKLFGAFFGGIFGFSIIGFLLSSFENESELNTTDNYLNWGDQTKKETVEFFGIPVSEYDKTKIVFNSDNEIVTKTNLPTRRYLYKDRYRNIKGYLIYNCTKEYPSLSLKPIEKNEKFETWYDFEKIKNKRLFAYLCPDWKPYGENLVNVSFDLERTNWKDEAKLINFYFLDKYSFNVKKGAFLCRYNGFENKYTYFYGSEWTDWEKPKNSFEKQLLPELNNFCLY